MMDENPSAFPTEAEVLIANAERQAIIDDLFDIIVEAGAGVWRKFNAALAKARA